MTTFFFRPTKNLWRSLASFLVTASQSDALLSVQVWHIFTRNTTWCSLLLQWRSSTPPTFNYTKTFTAADNCFGARSTFQSPSFAKRCRHDISHPAVYSRLIPISALNFELICRDFPFSICGFAFGTLFCLSCRLLVCFFPRSC